MKAILVIDMPNNCEECKLTYLDTGDDAYYGCPIRRCIFDGAEADANERYYDCPLRPLPSFKAVDLNDTRDVIMFCHGWNVCLEEITGETE